MKTFDATKIKACISHDLDEKKKQWGKPHILKVVRNQAFELKSKWRKSNGKLGVLLTRWKENEGKRSDFQGWCIKCIAPFHLCLSSSVFWHESPLLSNDFQENIPKKNLNLITFHVIWSCITYNILGTVTALKISSNCWDSKRPVRLLFLFPVCLSACLFCVFVL